MSEQKMISEMGHTQTMEKCEQTEAKSTIAVKREELSKYIQEKRPEILEKIDAQKLARKMLIQEFQAVGLTVLMGKQDNGEDLASSDVYEEDDAGKLIETILRVQVNTEEEIRKAYELAKIHQLGIMTIGAKTSALGVFEHGRNGIIGLQLQTGDSRNILPDLSHSAEGFTLIESTDRSMQIFCSENYPAIPHRIRAHAAVTIDQMNKFLNETLHDASFRFRIMPDPTSKGEAHIGAVIATGAEGGNRVKAADDILSCKIINAKGELHELDSEDAQKLVGLNGIAGTVTEATFEVTAFPKHEFGLLIPIKVNNTGNYQESFSKMLQLQAKLKKYSQSNNTRIQELKLDEQNSLIISGIEIMSSADIENNLGQHPDLAGQSGARLHSLSEQGDILLYITASSLSPNIDELPLQKILESLDVNLEELEFDDEENIDLPAGELCSKIAFLCDKRELEGIDKLRHKVPEHARAEAKKLGGVSQSTDLNIRITSKNITEDEQARAQIAAIYGEYVECFKNKPFHVSIYGHAHPGTGIGGGFDPHVRITLDLTDPRSRYEVAELCTFMKDQENALYQKLLKLDGTNGIEIHCPEKSGSVDFSVDKIRT